MYHLFSNIPRDFRRKIKIGGKEVVEIDIKASTWIIPAIRMKAGKTHRVPLSKHSLDILDLANKQHNYPYIFHGNDPEKHLSNNSMGKFVRDHFPKRKFTVHGFRSTFRDWAAEQTAYPDEIRKAASGHTVGDSVKEAYQRSDLLEKRRNLMNEWSNFMDRLPHQKSAKVTPIRKRK